MDNLPFAGFSSAFSSKWECVSKLAVRNPAGARFIFGIRSRHRVQPQTMNNMGHDVNFCTCLHATAQMGTDHQSAYETKRWDAFPEDDGAEYAPRESHHTPKPLIFRICYLIGSITCMCLLLGFSSKSPLRLGQVNHYDDVFSSAPFIGMFEISLIQRHEITHGMQRRSQRFPNLDQSLLSEPHLPAKLFRWSESLRPS